MFCNLPRQRICKYLLPSLVREKKSLRNIHSAPTILVPSPAFQQALANHIKDLSPAEQQAFNNGNNISIESLLSQINLFDETHRQTSCSRRCAERVQQFLTALQGYLKGLAPFLQQAEPISSLMIGGANLIIDVGINRPSPAALHSDSSQLGLKFAEFFEKLTDMMRVLGEHLGYLSKYATGFVGSPVVQQVRIAPYY